MQGSEFRQPPVDPMHHLEPEQPPGPAIAVGERVQALITLVNYERPALRTRLLRKLDPIRCSMSLTRLVPSASSSLRTPVLIR